VNRHVNAINARLSLRAPQRESLEILARITEIIPLSKQYDLAALLSAVQAEFPDIEDFERDFPSLCFALATGVGKTRLMGAFISYLHLAKGIRHFFVLAPNLTIYNKLIEDFTPNHPKYVFQGIAAFAQNSPEIITGDNYERVRGTGRRDLYGAISINIFNVSKINSEVRGGRSPRIKRLSEVIGESYFDYLSGLDDLVLLMDESHRYRASAGVRAINELKPVLGLELTATPQIERGTRSTPFKNVIYHYPLASALADGFVKEPAVATRENFDPANYTRQQLERLKLEDGVRIHESAKVELEVYARQHDRPIVKPFILVVAQDTAHANDIVDTIQNDAFFEGRYKERVITVHSKQRGEEADETVARLLAVEDPKEPTEIVVHVNKLKEGWDVTNLYTLVPLRAGRSRTLVEQSIGRGLRLPYGKRVGVPAVDRLTIVAHDMFQAIIDEANNPDSIIRAGVVVGRDVPLDGKKAVTVHPHAMGRVRATSDAGTKAPADFTTEAERQVATATLETIKRYEYLPCSPELLSSGVQERIVHDVTDAVTPVVRALKGLEEAPDIPSIVARATEIFVENTIDIPSIIVLPKGDARYGFHDFDLDVDGIRLQPVEDDILIQHLRTHQRERLSDGSGILAEERPENYLVHVLMGFDDISYDAHADLLYKLAGQVVHHLRSYLPNENAVSNVLQYHQQQLGELIHSQMQAHYWEDAAGYEVRVNKGFMTLRPDNFAIPRNENIRFFRNPVRDRQNIRRMLFKGFKRCLYPIQRFQSDPERRFAVLLEDEAEHLKWFKPAESHFQIHYSHGKPAYEPDFVVETATTKYLCEPKAAREMKTHKVQAKALAAYEWCRNATDHERQHGGKPWIYLLIPDHAITSTATLQGLAAAYVWQAPGATA